MNLTKPTKPQKKAAKKLPPKLANAEPGAVFHMDLIGQVLSRESMHTISVHRYKIGKHRMYYDKTAGKAIGDIKRQAIVAWAALFPEGGVLNHPAIDITFCRPANKAQAWNRDAALVTILGVLHAAGVIASDKVKWCNGEITIRKAVLDDKHFHTKICLTQS